MFIASACVSANVPPPTATPQPPTAITLPTIDASNPYPLSEPGPYQVGMRTFTAVDTARDDREVGITVWYPAMPDAGADVMKPVRDAQRMKRGLILAPVFDQKQQKTRALPVHRGFAWASVDGID